MHAKRVSAEKAMPTLRDWNAQYLGSDEMRWPTPIVLLMALGLCTVRADASAISGIQVEPTVPTTNSIAQLNIDLFYPTLGFSLSDVDVVALDPNSFQVDVIVNAPDPEDIVLPATDSELANAPLGVLDEGLYSYTVNLFDIPRLSTVPIFQESRSGSFSVVVPEPASVWILAVGWIACTASRRRGV